MSRLGKQMILAVLGIWAFPGIGIAISVPSSDPTYIPHDDLVAWNWRILDIAGVIPEVPHLPTGSTEFIRMYSNGSPQPTPNAPGFTPLVEPVISPNDAQGDIGPGPEWWYGLEYAGGNPNIPQTVSRVLTGGEVLSTIRQIENDSSVISPVFLFDQNQIGNQPIPADELPDGWPTTGSPAPELPVPMGRDKWLRGRLILVPPTVDFLEG